jgi:hypothetical protein
MRNDEWTELALEAAKATFPGVEWLVDAMPSVYTHPSNPWWVLIERAAKRKPGAHVNVIVDGEYNRWTRLETPAAALAEAKATLECWAKEEPRRLRRKANEIRDLVSACPLLVPKSGEQR